MQHCEFLTVIIAHIIISVSAFVLSLVTVLITYQFEKKRHIWFNLLNLPAVALSIFAAYHFFEHNKLLLFVILLSIGYLYFLRELNIRIMSFDVSFRIIYLSMGFTRNEYLKNLLLSESKLFFVRSLITFILISTIADIFHELISTISTNCYSEIIVFFMGLLVVLCVINWTKKDIVKNNSKFPA